jgi:glycine/D-amino acid oxidase-like deaminating enzyme
MPGFLEPIWETVFRLATWAALIFGALSIGSAFVSAWVGWEITDATQKDADKKIKAADERIADAQERAAKAAERAAELELALAREVAERKPRTISPQQRAALVELLTPERVFKGTVWINAAMDGEAWQFGEQISSALKEAGFTVEDTPFGARALAFNKPGLFVAVKDITSQPKHGGPIFKALGLVGIPVTGQENKELPSNDIVEIQVGPHP